MVQKHLISALILMACGVAAAGTKPNMNLFFPMQHPALPLVLKSHSLKPHHSIKTAAIHSGSLKANILRIAKENGWEQVLWHVPSDYQWVGETKISAPTIEKIFKKLLADYPVQAIFYKGNHILLIQPRTLR